MTLNPNTPERYQSKDGRRVIAITELKVPIENRTHIVHYKTNWTFWNESGTFLIEIPQERWRGLEFSGECIVLDSSIMLYNSIELLKERLAGLNYTHAINLSTLEIVKL